MPILNIQRIEVGSVGSNPSIVAVQSNDSFSAITTAGYLNNSVVQNASIRATDEIHVNYGTNSASFAVFTPSFSNGIITLVAAESGVTLPTIANHIATYTNTNGNLSEDPATAISGGNIQAGVNGVSAGSLISIPPVLNSGSLALKAVTNAGNFAAVISNGVLNQSSTWSLADPGSATSNILQAPSALVSGNIVSASGTAGLMVDGGIASNKVLSAGFANPDVSNLNLILVTATNLNNASIVAGSSLFAASGSKTYNILQITANLQSSFAGGAQNANFNIQIGASTIAGMTSAVIKGTANTFLLGGSSFPYSNNTLPLIQSGSSLSIVANALSDYTQGIIQLNIVLIRAS